jgi:alpha/beta superfamily hydrolase
MAEITSTSILPANRIEFDLTTADNLNLVGELALPVSTAPVGTMICLHPLPTHGGMMDSHVFRKAAWRLPELAKIAVLRFNFRGAKSARGQSQGEWDAANGEGLDLKAAVDYAQSQHLPKPWLVGWSFGTDVVLRHARNLDIAGIILLSPPLRWTSATELDAWKDATVPITALIPEHDEFLPPSAAAEKFAPLVNIELINVTGAKHLWTGEPSVYRVLSEIVQRINPAAMPLPTEFAGEMQKFSEPLGS